MRVKTDSDFQDAYQALMQEVTTAQDRKLNIYVSTSDVDSLCAFRILQHVFRENRIPYSAFPVTGWEDLQRRYAAEVAEDDDETPRAFVLINCGATEDLTELLGAKKETRFYVFDSHRPVHHMNLLEVNTQLLVFYHEDEGSLTEDQLLKMAGMFEEEDEEEEEEEDDDEQDEGEEGRRRSDPGEDAGARPSKRQRREEAAEEREQLVQKYYGRGSFFGTPSGFLLYDLAHKLRQAGVDDLWLAIVAVTDHYVHSLMSHEEYERRMVELHDYVTTGGYSDAAADILGTDGQVYSSSHNALVMPETDYRVPLLRFWTLYEGLVNSPYVAARVRTWTEEGRRSLEMFLARLGVPLAIAHTDYREASVGPYKERLHGNMDKFAPSFNLPDIAFPSFTLKHGYKKEVSATDVVYAASALLDVGHLPSTQRLSGLGDAASRAPFVPASTSAPEATPLPGPRRAGEQGEDSNQSARSDQTAFDLAGRPGGDPPGDNTPGTRPSPSYATSLGIYEGFWRAWEALDLKNESALEDGVVSAKRLQRVMLRQVGAALAQRNLMLYMNNSHFRAMDLSQTSVLQDRELLQQPLALARLASFMQDIYFTHKARLKPHVVVGPANALGFCLVVAVAGRPVLGESNRNPFTVAFSRAADQCRAQHRLVNFESSVLEVQAGDVRNFLGTLKAVLQEMEEGEDGA